MENTNKWFLLLCFIVVTCIIWYCNKEKRQFRRIVNISIKKFRKEYGDPAFYLDSDDRSTYLSRYRNINHASFLELKTLDILLEVALSRARVESTIEGQEKATSSSYKTMVELDKKLIDFRNTYGNPMNYLDANDREIWKEFSFENKAIIGIYWDILNRAYTRALELSQANEKQVG